MSRSSLTTPNAGAAMSSRGCQRGNQSCDLLDQTRGAQGRALEGEGGQAVLIERSRRAANLDDPVGVEEESLPRAQPHAACIKRRVRSQANAVA
jgi:hypothetical protein